MSSRVVSCDRFGDHLLVAPGSEGARCFAIDWRQRRVGVRARVALHAAADAVQVEVESCEFYVGFEDFPGSPRVKDERGFARQAGSALSPQFAAKIAALQGVHVVLNEGEVEL